MSWIVSHWDSIWSLITAFGAFFGAVFVTTKKKDN